MDGTNAQKSIDVIKNILFSFFLMLIAGYILLPKGFPKLKIDIGPFPLYITEVFIILSILAIIVIVALNESKIGKIYFYNLFLFFFAILLTGLAIGFFNYRDISFVLRQSALFYYALFYFIVSYLFSERKRIKYFFAAVFIFSNLLILIFLIRYLGFETMLLGFVSEYLIGGYYFPIALTLIISINLLEKIGKRYLKVLLFIDIIILIVLSIVENVRGNWTAIAAAFIFSWIIAGSKKRFFINILIIFGILIIMAIIIWFSYPQALEGTITEIQSLKFFFTGLGDSSSFATMNTNWRLITWKGFLSEFAERPLTGWGFGKKFLAGETFEKGWTTGLSNNWVSTHNYIISFLYMTGIPGLISFLLIIVYYFIENLRFIKRQDSNENKSLARAFTSCVFYILILGLFEVVMETPYQGVFFWVFLTFSIILLKISGHRFLYNENTSNT